jgi:hypothetical protein
MKLGIVPAALFMGALLTGGCSMIDGQGGEKPAPAATAAPDTAETPKPKTVALADTETTSRIPRPKRKPEMVDPKALVGLDKTAISDLFGSPHRESSADPAVVWAWQADGCEMRLYLYPDVQNDTFKALAYEITTADGRKTSLLIDTCASRLKWANADAKR